MRSFAGKNDLQVDDADLVERRRLDVVNQAGRGRGRCPRARRGRATLDSKMCSRLRSGSASMPSSASSPDDRRRRRARGARRRRPASSAGGAANDRSTVSGMPGVAARACRSPRSTASRKRCDPLRRLRPNSASPSRHSSAGLRGEARRATSSCAPPRSRRSRAENRPAAASGNVSSRLPEVPLGIDRDRRDAVDRRLFQQRQAQARLAAAGHADANRVRRQVLGVVQQRLGLLRARGQIVFPAQIEHAQLFEILHRAKSSLRRTPPRGNGGVPCHEVRMSDAAARQLSMAPQGEGGQAGGAKAVNSHDTKSQKSTANELAVAPARDTDAEWAQAAAWLAADAEAPLIGWRAQ